MTPGAESTPADELQHVVAALRASEARLRAAVESGFDAVVIVTAARDAHGRILDFTIVDANTRAGALVDRSVASIVGQSLFDVFVHSRSAQLWEQCCTVVETGKPLETTQHVPTPGLPDRWVQRQLLPVGDGVAISSRDVTTRHLEQVALRTSEERHRELFEANGAIQLLVDAATGEIVDVNPAAEAFYGWPRATMRAMLITDIDDTSIEKWLAHATSLATAPAVHPSRAHRLATGEERHVETYTGIVELARQRVVHMIVQDVTERVRAERRLRESEARFRAVITAMRDGVVLYDETGTLSVHNPSALRILGMTGGQLLGVEPVEEDYDMIHDDGTPWPMRDLPALRALETGESQPSALMGIRRGSGEYAWIRVTADPLLRDGESRPHGSIAILSDVTELKAAEDRLRQAQKLEAVGQLAGGIAHDFNNVLTVIRGATGFLREALPPGAQPLDDVQAIERATDRAEGLTRQLLAFGRRQALRVDFTDLNTLLREYAITMRESMPPSIRVQLEASSEPATANVDRRRMLDALRSLVDNAREAMPSGGTITLATCVVSRAAPLRDGRSGTARRYVEVLVRDTGVGMSDEVKARVFEPFYSTQPFGAGRGMGLSSVHGMIAQSGGFIECDSRVGAGSTFRLYVPYAEAPQAGARRGAAGSSERTMGAPRGALLVEDDPMMRELGRRMLESLGHSVVVVESASDALAVLSATGHSIPLVVTDVVMPGMTGLELVLQAEKLHPLLAFVAITGHVVAGDVRAALDARRIPLLLKPFSRDALQAAIAGVLPARVQ